MKKVFLCVLMFLCMAGSMDAAGYRGNNRGRSYGHSKSSFSRSHRGGLVGEDVFEVDADRNLRHFFDFGASIGFHYCF